MNLLDNTTKIREIDKDNALGSIEAFPEQLQQIWSEMLTQKFPESLSRFESIVLTGMGGSAGNGRIAQALFSEEFKTPFEVVTEYSLPEYVNSQTLVIVSSYSGNTEETLACLEEAREKKAKIVAMTTGGKLGKLIDSGKIHGYVYSPRRNPLGYPKTAFGYSLGGLLGVLSNLKVIELSEATFKRHLKDFVKIQKNFLLTAHFEANPAKKMAAQLLEKVPFLIASEHLKGAAYCTRNQIHEIAHQNCLFFDLPELTHHLGEGMGKPKDFRQKCAYLSFRSNHYHVRNQLRYQVNNSLLKKLGIKSLAYKVKSQGKLAQVFEVINFGGFLAAYLSVLSGEDPGPEPWVIYFKKKLKQPVH